MKTDTVTYTVGQHLACFFEYGDASGLDDDEVREAEIMLSTIPENGPEGFSFMHTTIGEPVGFDRDEVSGLMGDCVELIAVFRKGTK